jgi:hypothetical protein
MAEMEASRLVGHNSLSGVLCQAEGGGARGGGLPVPCSRRGPLRGAPCKALELLHVGVGVCLPG